MASTARDERRMLPPPTLSVESIVTRVASQILRPYDNPQPAFFHHDAAFHHHQQQQHGYYNSFDKGPHQQEFGGIIPFIGRMLKLCILTTGLILVSAASYIMAYHALMPPRCATVPLFFDCTTDATTTMAAATRIHTSSTTNTPLDSNAIELPHRRFHFGYHAHQARESQHQQQPQTVDIILPSPASSSSAYATVDLFARHDSWEAFHPSVIPQPVAQMRLLQSRQAYYIELSLTLPASNRNQYSGIFGVHTELRSSVNETCLATSRRSARFPHESAWIQVIRNMILLPALLVGAMEESRSVTVLAFRHFTESKDFPLQHVRVSIVPQSSQAAWQHETPTQTSTVMTTAAIEITGGELRIGKELNRYQEILKGWYYSCFLVGTSMFAGFYAKLWSLLMNYSTGPSMDPIMMEEEPPCDLDMDFDEAWEDPATNFAEFEEAWGDAATFEDWGGGPGPSQQQGNEPAEEVHDEDQPPPTEPPEEAPFNRDSPRRRGRPPRRAQRQQSRYAAVSDSEGSWEDLYYPPDETGS